MRYEQILEGLQKALDELQEGNLTTPVIVEGEKDLRSLRRLGLTGIVLTANSGLPLFNFCEDISRRHKAVIVLTDWDSRGGTLCRRLQEGLVANGVRPNLEHRQKIAVLCRKDVKDVEGLPNYLLTLEKWTKVHRREGARKRTDESLRRARSFRGRSR